MDGASLEFVDEQSTKPNVKPPIIRGARACTVCRAAKMKCVGADDGQKQCQRCKRANVECVFEKHRRGRKPGSKLSEASKMLRRLEKGLNNAKLKSQSSDNVIHSPYSGADSRPGNTNPQYPGMLRTQEYSSPTTHFPSNELPPLNLPHYQTGDGYSETSQGARAMDLDDDDDDPDRNDEGMFPAKMIRKENQRHSFFRTILNPEQEAPSSSSTHSGGRGNSYPPPIPRTASAPAGLSDPITAGLIDEHESKVLFDMVFLRLNPFVNMFDPALHSVSYVRSKCPFLFTTLIMAGCKFFRPELYKACHKLANEFAVRAFAEAWKRVEVVQAFACLTHWKEPHENRAWTYIGYACRMAVELGLNRYVAVPPANETEFQMLERRNRERTYLVLFVHDRSLSMQTGKHWMLPEDDIVRYSAAWHGQNGATTRPEDVIVAAFVQLRRIAAETTDMFYSTKGNAAAKHHDVNYEVVLRNCNGKLTQWMETWQGEMRKAGGESFHTSMLSFFRLHVRLFLNSFGIQASMSPSSHASPSLQALSACCTSALETLQIVSKDFASMSMLRYGQDSVTVMTAYSAIFLLKLLRSSNTLAQLHEGTAHEVHSLITKTADAYEDASMLSPASTSAAYHARFLRSLVANDMSKARQNDKERYDMMPIDPRLQSAPNHAPGPPAPSSQVHSHAQSQQSMYAQPMVQDHAPSFHFPASPHIPTHPLNSPESTFVSETSSARQGTANNPQYPSAVPNMPQHASELDARYWRNMFLDLGFEGENPESAANDHHMASSVPYSEVRTNPNHPAHQSHPSHQGHPNHLPHPNIPAHASHPTHVNQQNHQPHPPPHSVHPTAHQNQQMHPSQQNQLQYHNIHGSAPSGYGR